MEELIKAAEAKRMTDANNREYQDEIKMLNILIKEAVERGSHTCGVNIKLIPSVIGKLEEAGYGIYNMHSFGRKTEDEEIYYVLRW